MKNLIRNQLNRIDWNFIDKISGLAPKIHWYPGTFPSEIPSTIIQAFTKQNDIVFDPYGGIGTSAVEAIRIGRRAYVAELNLIALLIAYTECGLILLKSLNENYIEGIISHIIDELNISSDRNYTLPGFNKKNRSKNNYSKHLLELIRPKPDDIIEKYVNKIKPQWELLSKWIEEKSLININKIWDKINTSNIDSFSKILCITMLSANLRRNSSQIKSWGHLSDNVYPKEFEYKDSNYLCSQWLNRIRKKLLKTNIDNDINNNNNDIRVWIKEIDWRTSKTKDITFTNQISLLITSPPYADAIDYIRAQRLSFYLLGFSDEKIDKLAINEIGARRKRTKKNSKIKWAEELVKALDIQLQYLSQTANIALILPHKDSGREIGSKMLQKFLTDRQWALILDKDRSIDQLNTIQSWTSIKKETVKIYSNFIKD